MAVLGKMAELGDHAAEAYPQINRIAADLGLSLVTFGEEAVTYGAKDHFNNHEEAATWLSGATCSGDTVLFKGSRMAAMERVMEHAFPE